MKDRTRVIERLRREARELTIRMPFERGAPRAAMIERRTAAVIRGRMKLAQPIQRLAS